MIDLAALAPDIDVQPADYNRLLGYPRNWVLQGRARELADSARLWYAAHGRPGIYARRSQNLDLRGSGVRVEGAAFSSSRLQKMFQDAAAHQVILVAVTAGPELEEEAQRLWREEKPDEYFFLETFGSAVVERLISITGARLCDWAEKLGMAVLPHYSPGYSDWDIGEQVQLFALMRPCIEGSIDVLDSGALRPKKSLLAVFGITAETDRLQRLTELVPCQNCSYRSCGYRRAPFLDRDVEYATTRKALKRWAAERLVLDHREDRSVHARFRFDGTTCTNTGRPLAFQYDVRLGPREEGYPIQEERCAPAPGDTGHTFMCQYLKEPSALMAAIDGEKPLLGQPLNNVLSWRRATCSTGCYCDPAAREHKWGLVLETIHYALH